MNEKSPSENLFLIKYWYLLSPINGIKFLQWYLFSYNLHMKNYTSIYEKPFDNHLKPKETILPYTHVQPAQPMKTLKHFSIKKWKYLLKQLLVNIEELFNFTIITKCRTHVISTDGRFHSGKLLRVNILLHVQSH